MERIGTIVPTSGMSFDRQIMILRAYVVLSDFGRSPVQYLRVVNTLNIARSQVSGVNSFFVGLGLLNQVEDGLYLPTACTLEFYSQMPGTEDFSKIKRCIESSELFQIVRNFILIHGSASETTILSEVLRASGTSTNARARRAIEWLARCELIEINDDEVISIP